MVQDFSLLTLRQMPHAIVVIDADGAVLHWNRAATRLFGYAPGELIGQPVETLLPERLRQAHVAHRHAYRAQPRTRAMGIEPTSVAWEATVLPSNYTRIARGRDPR